MTNVLKYAEFYDFGLTMTSSARYQGNFLPKMECLHALSDMALPVLSLCRPLQGPAKVIGSVFACVLGVNSLDKSSINGRNHQQIFIERLLVIGQVLQTITVISGTLFHLTFSLYATAYIDISLHSIQLMGGSYGEILPLIASVVYLIVLYTGSIELILISFTLQILMNIIQAKQAWSAGHRWMALSKLLVAYVQYNQLVDQVQQLQKTVRFLDSFEERYKNKASSYNLSGEGKSEPEQGRIFYVNGAMTSLDEAKHQANYISELAGDKNVYGIHNPSNGLLRDFFEIICNKLNGATPPVRHLHKGLNQFFSEAKSHEKALIICHSQGAVLTRAALMSYPQEYRNRIEVVATAPAGFINEKYCNRVDHYVSRGDIVPWLFDPTERHRHIGEHILPKHSEATDILDHEFVSPTYKRPITDAIERLFAGVRELVSNV